MIENSYVFEEADLTDIKNMGGLFFYKDKHGEIELFRSKYGLYQNSEGAYYLNGHKQAVYNNQLIPQQFIDIVNDGCVVFNYTNIWANVKPMQAEGLYTSPYKTMYAVDNDGKLWYFQNGECIDASDMNVNPEYAQKTEEMSDWYTEYRAKNSGKTIDGFEEDLTACRYLMRQWRDAAEKKDEELQTSLLKEIDNTLKNMEQ
jgi:ribosomal protein L24E